MLKRTIFFFLLPTSIPFCFVRNGRVPRNEMTVTTIRSFFSLFKSTYSRVPMYMLVVAVLSSFYANISLSIALFKLRFPHAVYA